MTRQHGTVFLEDEDTNEERPLAKPPHYYGDVTRRLFIAAGIIILVGLPIFSDYLPTIAIASAVAAVAIAIVAGTASPRSLSVQILFLALSAIAVAFFELYAIYTYRYFPLEGTGVLFFITTQTLAVLFFLALYFSTKSVRWMSKNIKRSQTQ